MADGWDMIGEIEIPILKLHFLEIGIENVYPELARQHRQKALPYIFGCPMMPVLGTVSITLFFFQDNFPPVTRRNKVQPHLLVSQVPIPPIGIY
jgi:hypothetical protein